MLLDTAEGSANLKDEAPYGLFVTQYVCKSVSTVISDYSCQDPGARGQDPLKAVEKQT